MKGYNPRFLKMRGKLQDIVVTQQDNEPVVRDRVFTNESNTTSQQESRAEFGTNSGTWKTISPEGRASYSRQAATMLGKSGKPMTGKNLYVQIASSLTLLEQNTPVLCPQKPALLPKMPQQVFLSGYSNGSAFVLLVHSDGVPVPVICEAIQAVSAGVEMFKSKSFRVISVAPSFFSPSTPLQTAYALKFGKPFSGTQIAVRLTPVDPSGYRGTPVIYSAFVAASQEEMDADLEKRRAEAAVKRPALKLVAA